MGHYYDENPEVKSNQKKISYHFDKTRLEFTTDAGVFSKDKVDFGSDLLIQTFLKEHPPGPSKHIADVGVDMGQWFNNCKDFSHHQLSLLTLITGSAEINKTKIKLKTLKLLKVIVYQL